MKFAFFSFICLLLGQGLFACQPKAVQVLRKEMVEARQNQIPKQIRMTAISNAPAAQASKDEEETACEIAKDIVFSTFEIAHLSTQIGFFLTAGFLVDLVAGQKGKL